MSEHKISLIREFIKDYVSAIENAMHTKGKEKKKQIKRAEDMHYLIINLVKE